MCDKIAECEVSVKFTPNNWSHCNWCTPVHVYYFYYEQVKCAIFAVNMINEIHTSIMPVCNNPCTLPVGSFYKNEINKCTTQPKPSHTSFAKRP